MTTDLENRISQKTGGQGSYDILWTLDPVGGDGSFAYTAGLADHPERGYELACTGLPAELACQVLGNAAEQLLADGLDPADELILDEVLEDVYTVRLRAVSNTSTLNGIHTEFGDRPPVWQVLWPDVMHRFPDEPGYLNPRAHQLLL
ncbi:DUF4262 domain-containing protein [Streptomyces anulatus]|uniref:DUF4262 domain-containing protein n=1 Tax=Streptomyces anulatus TaxID=1892 RepID=UPI0037DC5BFF|nr:DUF4262 domain-containing protein [Streptomyces anulatus]